MTNIDRTRSVIERAKTALKGDRFELAVFLREYNGSHSSLIEGQKVYSIESKIYTLRAKTCNTCPSSVSDQEQNRMILKVKSIIQAWINRAEAKMNTSDEDELRQLQGNMKVIKLGQPK